MAELHQSFAVCKNCESPAKFHCNTCGDVLCQNCKTNHQTSEGTRYHNIVPYTEKVDPRHTANIHCQAHPGSSCLTWCTTCGQPVCLACITSNHNGHKYLEIDKKISEMRGVVVKELKELRKNFLPRLEDQLKSAKQLTKSYNEDIEKVEKEMEERANVVRNQVEVAIQNNKKELNEIQTENLDALHAQEKEVSDGIDTINGDIKSLEDKLAPSNLANLLQHTGDARGKNGPPLLRPAQPSLVSDPKVNIQTLQELLGKITLTKEVHLQADQSVNSSTGKFALPKFSCTGLAGNVRLPFQLPSINVQNPGLPKPIHTVRPRVGKTLLPVPSIIAQFDVDIFYPIVACCQDGTAWVKTDDSCLQLVDRKGAQKVPYLRPCLA